MTSNILWVTWEEQRRNKPIAEYIGAEFFEFSEIRKYPSYSRYLVGIWKTLRLYVIERPATVIVQNPSFILAAFSVVASKILNFKLGVDTHNRGFGHGITSNTLHRINRWIQRNADFIIAHNSGIKNEVTHYGGNIIVLPDRIPYIPITEPKQLEGKYNFVYICSYNTDEPYQDVLSVFKSLGKDYHLYVTGNFIKGGLNPDDYESNIHFTGRIPWNEYNKLLNSCDATIDLTTRDNCLLCGAYESVAVVKPMILPQTSAITSYFYKGATYCNTSDRASIQNCVKAIVHRYPTYKNEVVELKSELIANWPNLAQPLVDIV